MTFLTLLLGSAFAVPLQVNQQGRLLDADGKGLTGDHELTFRLMNDPDDGFPQWEDTLSVDFTNGYYSVVLGADEENNPLDDAVFSQYPLFLELKVDGEALEPRQPVTSVPYAQMAGVAEVAESVDGGSVNASEISVNGNPVVNADGQWVGEAPTVDFMNLQNRPPGLDDGDDDTQLTQTEVVDYINGSQVNLGTASQVDGSDIVTANSFAGYLPADLADGDADTLAGLNCATGEIASWDGNGSWVCTSDATLEWADVENMLVNNPVDLNAATTIGGNAIITSVDDSDTLQSLSCGNGEVAKYDDSLMEWYCDIDIDTDTVLSDTEVLGFVNGQALSLASGTQVDGSDVVTVDTFTANLPTDLADGDANTQLGQSDVVSYVEAGSVNLAQNSQVNSRNIVGQPSVCSNGQVLVYNSTSNDWECGDDTDTTLTPTEMQTMVEMMSLNLQNLPQVNHSNVLTEDSSITLSQLDVSTANEGDSLVVTNGSLVFASGSSGNQCSETIVQHESGSVYVPVTCDTYTYVSNGSVTNYWPNPTQEDFSATYLEYGSDNDVYSLINADSGTHIISGTHISSSIHDSFPLTNSRGNTHCTLKSNGLATCWGYDDELVVTNTPLDTFISLDYSEYNACGIKTDNTITCWGRNDYGQISQVPSGNFSKVAVSGCMICGLSVAGTVTCWGASPYGGCPTYKNYMNNLSGTYSDIILGSGYCAKSGTYDCTGGPPSNRSYMLLPKRGGYCYKTSSSQLLCTGTSYSATLDGSFQSYHVSARSNKVPIICGLTSAGSVSCSSSSIEVPNATYTKICSGYPNYQNNYDFFCGLTGQGDINCWGSSSTISNQAPTSQNFTDLTCNETSVCGLLDTGNVLCWGYDDNDQLLVP